MKRNSAQNVQWTSLDDLLGVSQPVTDVGSGDEGVVVRLPLSSLHEFKGHPFRVLEDEKMAETVESIRRHGVLVPGIVRPDGQGQYEIIAGHRRRHASELAGLSDMPVIIQNLSDDEATVIMVDSNIQREDLLPSERANAYRMKYDALKRIGTEGIRNDEILARQSGESRNTIQRYIRLTYLIPELLQMVDEKKLPKNTAADISYLKKSEQVKLLAVMLEQKSTPSGEQAARLKEYSKDGQLTEAVMQLVLERTENTAKVSLKNKEVRRYFPETYTGKQIEEIIYKLLEEWKEREGNKL